MTPSETLTMLRGMNIRRNSTRGNIQKELDKIPNCPFKAREGASKICLISETLPFVVKWSYTDPWDYDSSDRWNEYDEAYDEVLIYRKAMKEGLEALFPATALLGEINGIKFVVQLKVDTSVRNLSDRKFETYNYLSRSASAQLVNKVEQGLNAGLKNSTDDLRRDIDHLWIRMLLVLYGKRICKKLCHFVQENGINDLHGGNLGYKNDRPVLLDFSGFHR